MTTSFAPRSPPGSPLLEMARFLLRSRSLASMLPSLILTGVVTLLATGIARTMPAGLNADSFQLWMESWLVSWPIAFPVAYVSRPALARIAARFASPAERKGLAVREIEEASARVTRKNGFRVRRNLKDPFTIAQDR